MNRLAHRVCSAFALALLAAPGSALGGEESPAPCTEDAMIVFDASGSMAGSLAEGIGAKIRRIDEVRKALAQALPHVVHFRRIGLITYGRAALTSNAMSSSRCGPNRTRRSRSWLTSAR